MKHTRDDIEIFVITRNRAAFLKDALESLLAQSAGPFKITVLDDASTDGTAACVEGLRARFPNLGYVRNAQNIGQAANIRQAAARSQAAYTMIFHDDDALHPRYLEMVLRVLDTIPDVSSVGTDGARVSVVSTQDWEMPSLDYYWCPDSAAYARFLYLLGRLIFPATVYKTEYLRAIGDLTETFGGVIFDRPFNMEAVPRGAAVIFKDRAFIRYRVHPGQETYSRVGDETYEHMVRHNLYFKRKLSGSAQGRVAFWVRCYKTLKSLHAMRGNGHMGLRAFVRKANREGAGCWTSALCNLPVAGPLFYGLCNIAAGYICKRLPQGSLDGPAHGGHGAGKHK